ncbi:MAG: phosphopantothenoylcysteine decarboxylase [Elusimicrobiota bacterium]|nr:phosphopantothenoylcysteine decarboxylase [Elusimicrobiota bacterium]
MTLRGLRVLLTSGPTREPLDPVRYLTNASSGAMGFALAAEARRRGAKVTVVCGPVSLPAPKGVTVVPVVTALQMRRETLRRSRGAAVVIGAAAVADWRPARFSTRKLKRGAGRASLTLTPNPDIIKDAAARRLPGQVFVGFALETHRAAAYARRKLVRKGLDLVVANGPATLASGRIRATLVSRDGLKRLATAPKPRVARAILDEVSRLLERRARRAD